MVGAIRAAAIDAEKRLAFVANALASKAETLKSGEGYPANEVHACIRARATGVSVSRPEAKSWRD